MRSQIFAGLAFGLVAVVAGAPMESRASEEKVTIDGAIFVREDANGNDNWDAITSAGLSLVTSSDTIRCQTNSPPLPSTVYTCADPAYSFQITSRPGYNLYTINVSHKVSDGVTLTGKANVGCNGPIPMSCAQVGSREATLTAA